MQAAVLPVQAPRPRPQLERIEGRRLIDMNGCRLQLSNRRGELRPVLVRQMAAGAQFALVDAAYRAEHA